MFVYENKGESTPNPLTKYIDQFSQMMQQKSQMLSEFKINEMMKQLQKQRQMPALKDMFGEERGQMYGELEPNALREAIRNQQRTQGNRAYANTTQQMINRLVNGNNAQGQEGGIEVDPSMNASEIRDTGKLGMDIYKTNQKNERDLKQQQLATDTFSNKKDEQKAKKQLEKQKVYNKDAQPWKDYHTKRGGALDDLFKDALKAKSLLNGGTIKNNGWAITKQLMPASHYNTDTQDWEGIMKKVVTDTTLAQKGNPTKYRLEMTEAQKPTIFDTPETQQRKLDRYLNQVAEILLDKRIGEDIMAENDGEVPKNFSQLRSERRDEMRRQGIDPIEEVMQRRGDQGEEEEFDDAEVLAHPENYEEDQEYIDSNDKHYIIKNGKWMDK